MIEHNFDEGYDLYHPERKYFIVNPKRQNQTSQTSLSETAGASSTSVAIGSFFYLVRKKSNLKYEIKSIFVCYTPNS